MQRNHRGSKRKLSQTVARTENTLFRLQKGCGGFQETEAIGQRACGTVGIVHGMGYEVHVRLWDMWEQYYDSVEGNFDKTIKHIVVNGLWDKYDARLQQCVKWSDGNGYDFADAIGDMYEEGKSKHC